MAKDLEHRKHPAQTAKRVASDQESPIHLREQFSAAIKTSARTLLTQQLGMFAQSAKPIRKCTGWPTRSVHVLALGPLL